MRTKDALKISTKNVKVYFKRSLMLMATMGITFGLALTINLWFRGMEKSYKELATSVTDGRVVIEATNSMAGMVMDEERTQITRQEMASDIEAHGGKILGDAQKFGAFGSMVLPVDIVKNAIEIELSKAPTDAAPVLVSTFLGEQLLGKKFPTEYASAVKKQKDYEEYRNEIIGKTFIDDYGAKYYVVGLASGNFQVGSLAFSQLERRNNDLLNPVLELVPTPEGRPIVIDNGRMESWQVGEDIVSDVIIPTTDSDTIVAVFDNGVDAYDYFRHGKGRFMNTEFANRAYSVDVVAGLSPETEYIMCVMQLIINVISVVLGVIAMIVVVFTSIRLVDQDKQNIALYYSLGATARQVRIIYLCYFLELMVGAAVLAFGLASMIVLLFTGLNHDLLSIQAMLGFNQATYEPIWWYGVNITVFVIIIAMLLMAPLCVLINRKRLSAATLEG